MPRETSSTNPENRQAKSATGMTTEPASVVREPRVISDRNIVIPRETTTARTPMGRAITIEHNPGSDREMLVVAGEGGDVEVRIELTPAGPVLNIDAVGVRIGAAGRVRVDCETFEVAASERIGLRSEHETAILAGTDAIVASKDDTRIVGGEVDIAATSGNAHVRANDDVHLDGERVMLNSPR